VWPIGGDVKAWIEFIFGLKGNTQKRFPTSCKGKRKHYHWPSELGMLGVLLLLLVSR